MIESIWSPPNFRFRILGQLIEEIGMSARSDERQDATLVTIDQTPVALNMTAAKAFPWPL